MRGDLAWWSGLRKSSVWFSPSNPEGLRILPSGLAEAAFTHHQGGPTFYLKNKLVDLVDVEFIEKIDLYWSLNIEQILSYAYIVFKNLMKSNRTIELKDIVSEFLVVAKLYSPDNAVEYIKRKTTNANMVGGKCE